jgi:hypothetical protein
MILYNISLIVEDSSREELLAWLKTNLQQTSYDIRFLKMLDSPHEGTTYCLQFVAADERVLQSFQDNILSKIQAYIVTNHPEKVFIFDSKMKYLAFTEGE